MFRDDPLRLDQFNTVPLAGKIFQECPYCRRIWLSRNQFLTDPTLVFNGYQADFEAPEMGLFLFTHRTPGCGTTIAMEVRYFQDLYRGPIYIERKSNTTECPGHCLRVFNFERCENRCECAYIRELMQILKGIRNHIPPVGENHP